jgi:hypothetical protein
LRDGNLVFSFKRGQGAVRLSISVPVFRIDAEVDALYAILNQGHSTQGRSGPRFGTQYENRRQLNEHLAAYKKATKEPRQAQRILAQLYLRTVEGESSSAGGERDNPNGVFRLSGLNLATTQLPWFIAHGSPGAYNLKTSKLQRTL